MFRGGLRRRIVTGIGVIAAGLLGAGIPVALALSGAWSSSYAYVSTDTGSSTSEAPAVALSSGGDIAALWLEDSATDTTAASAELDATFDSGSGFGPTQTLAAAGSLAAPDPLAVGNDYPQVAEDAAGDIFAVWISNGNVIASYRTAGSPSFSAPLTVNSGGPGTEDESPELAVDAEGDAVIVWEQNDGEAGYSIYDDAALYDGAAPAGSRVGQFSGANENQLGSNIYQPPSPTIAMNASGAAVIVWDNNNGGSDGSDINYVYTPDIATTVFTGVGNGAVSGDTLSQPAVAINADGDVAAAWVHAGSSATEVYEGDITATNAADNGNVGFTTDSVSTGVGTGGGALGSIDEADPTIAMKTDSGGDRTTALAFYDVTDDEVVDFNRPAADFGDGWQGLGSGTFWSTGAGAHNWVAEPTDAEQQPEIALTSSASGDSGPVTMVWTGSASSTNTYQSITSSDTGSFASSAPVTLESGSEPQCTEGGNDACAALAADASGDLVALWQQINASGHPEVAADCYKGSGSSNPGFNPAACTTSTTTSTTTPTAPTSSGTTSASTTTISTTGTATAASTPPVVGQTVNGQINSGTVLIELPGTHTFVNADTLPQIPVGAIVDATHGHVQLTFALPDGSTETDVLWGGEFRVGQSSSGAVNLALAGGSYAGCPKPRHRRKGSVRSHAPASAARGRVAYAKHKATKKPGSTIRSLWSSGKGNFTTKGKNGAAAVLGTSWLTRDQCDGTYFYVQSTSNDPHGAIEVTVNHPHRHRVLLTRGHSFLAPAPGYS